MSTRPPISPPGRTTVGYQVRPGGGRAGCIVCGVVACTEHKRCGAYVEGLSCCKPAGHPEDAHCGHALVSGTPGCIGPGGRGSCDGSHGEPFYTDLLSATERHYRDRRPVRPSTPPTGETP